MFCVLILFFFLNFRSKKGSLVEEEVKYLIKENPDKRPKAHVDKVFFRQLTKLLKIVIPGCTSTEAGLLVLVALSLISRSLCDLWLIQNGTLVER